MYFLRKRVVILNLLGFWDAHDGQTGKKVAVSRKNIFALKAPFFSLAAFCGSEKGLRGVTWGTFGGWECGLP